MTYIYTYIHNSGCVNTLAEIRAKDPAHRKVQSGRRVPEHQTGMNIKMYYVPYVFHILRSLCLYVCEGAACVRLIKLWMAKLISWSAHGAHRLRRKHTLAHWYTGDRPKFGANVPTSMNLLEVPPPSLHRSSGPAPLHEHRSFGHIEGGALTHA